MTAPDKAMGRHVAIASSGSTVSLVAVFAEAVVAVRLLSAEAYGTFILATVVAAFLTMLADVGMKAAATQAVAAASDDDRARLASTALGLRLMSISVVTVIAFVAGDAVRSVVNGDFGSTVVLVVAMFVATSLEEVLIAILRGYEAHRAIAVLQVVRAAVRLGMSALLLSLDWGPEALAVSWATAYAVAAAGAFIALPDRTFAWDRGKATQLLSFGRVAQLNRVVGYTVTFVPVAILGRHSSNAVVAVFAVAQRIPSGLQTISDSFSAVYYPRMSGLLARARRDEALQLLERSVLVSSALLGLVSVGVAFLGAEVLGLLFGSPYTEGGGTFTLLMLELTVAVPNVIIGYTLSSAGRPGGPALLSLLGAVVLIPATLLLVDTAEFRAPAIAMIASEVAVFPAAVWLLKRADLEFRWPPYVVEVGVIAGFAAAAVVASRGLDGVPALTLAAVACSACMLAAFRFLNDLGELSAWPSR